VHKGHLQPCYLNSLLREADEATDKQIVAEKNK
jgi:hypothetical protein